MDQRLPANSLEYLQREEDRLRTLAPELDSPIRWTVTQQMSYAHKLSGKQLRRIARNLKEQKTLDTRVLDTKLRLQEKLLAARSAKEEQKRPSHAASASQASPISEKKEHPKDGN